MVAQQLRSFVTEWSERAGYEILETIPTPPEALKGAVSVIARRATRTSIEYWATAVSRDEAEPMSFFKIRMSKKKGHEGEWVPADSYGAAIYTYEPFTRQGLATRLWALASSEHHIVRARIETQAGEKFFNAMEKRSA